MSSIVTQHYVDVAGRRVHYRRRGEGPPVCMLHQSPRSSVALQPLMALGSQSVCMLAFDTPGCGESEALAASQPDASDYADAFADTLTALGIERAVVYGTHTGAAIAMAFAVRHPRRVARLVIDGIGVFDAAERAGVLSDYLPPFAPAVDGTHLVWLWSRLRDQFFFFPWNHRGTGARLWLPLPEPAYMQFAALDFLRAGDHYRAPYAAAFSYRPAEWLSHLRVPTFIGAREDDMLLSHLERLGEVPGNVRVEVLSAERSRWAYALWAQLQEGTEGLPDAPPPPHSVLPQHRLVQRLRARRGRAPARARCARRQRPAAGAAARFAGRRAGSGPAGRERSHAATGARAGPSGARRFRRLGRHGRCTQHRCRTPRGARAGGVAGGGRARDRRRQPRRRRHGAPAAAALSRRPGRRGSAGYERAAAHRAAARRRAPAGRVVPCARRGDPRPLVVPHRCGPPRLRRCAGHRDHPCADRRAE